MRRGLCKLSPEGTSIWGHIFTIAPGLLHQEPRQLPQGIQQVSVIWMSPPSHKQNSEWWGQGHRRQKRVHVTRTPKTRCSTLPRGEYVSRVVVPGQSLPLSLLCHAGNSLKAKSSQGDCPQTKERTDEWGSPGVLSPQGLHGQDSQSTLPLCGRIILGSSHRGHP